MRRFSIIFLFLVYGLWSMVYSPAFAASQKESEKVLKQAVEKEQAGDYEGAQALYESILNENPAHEKALLGLGQVHYWQGNYQKAVDAYAKILEHDSNHVQALVGSGKAYLALGKQRKAEEFFNRAKKMEPENEEIEAVQPQLARKTKIRLEGGYLTENPSYAAQTQGESQEISITKERTYGFGLSTEYLIKFNQDAFDTKLFGHYYVLENTRIDLAFSFAPQVFIVPRQSYEGGLAQTIWKITGEVHYLFQDFQQANLHTIRPAIFVEPYDFIKIGGGYEFQNLRFGTTSRNFQGGFAEVKVTPTENIAVYGHYSRIQRGFEGGRRASPFVNYRAHVGGGGIQVDLMASYSIRFDARFEDRNNGEKVNTYTVLAGYVF